MPPPYQRNPVKAARSEFLGEQPERYYFPEPGKESTFGPYFSGRQLSNLDIETDDYLTKRSDMLARRRGNAFDHILNESRARMLPFQEEQGIAGAQYGKARYESDTRLLPSAEEEAMERNRAGAIDARISQQLAPDAGEIEQQKALRQKQAESQMERIISDDPAERHLSEWTKDPNDLYNYRAFLNREDRKLPKSVREQNAFRRSMRLIKDRNTISGLYEAMESGDLSPNDLDSLLDVDMDDEGNFYGQYVKPDKLSRSRVQKILAKNHLRKEQAAKQKEERQATRLDIDSRSRAFIKIIGDAEKTLQEAGKDTPEYQEAAAKKRAYMARLEALYSDDEAPSAPAQSQAQAPASQTPSVRASQDLIDSAFSQPKSK